jgi:hypothetical protein
MAAFPPLAALFACRTTLTSLAQRFFALYAHASALSTGNLFGKRTRVASVWEPTFSDLLTAPQRRNIIEKIIIFYHFYASQKQSGGGTWEP